MARLGRGQPHRPIITPAVLSAGAGVTVTPGTLALTLTTFAPTVTATANITVTPGKLALTLSTFAPTVTATANVTVTPGVLALTLSTYAPTVTVTTNVAPPAPPSVEGHAGGGRLQGWPTYGPRGPVRPAHAKAGTLRLRIRQPQAVARTSARATARLLVALQIKLHPARSGYVTAKAGTIKLAVKAQPAMGRSGSTGRASRLAWPWLRIQQEEAELAELLEI